MPLVIYMHPFDTAAFGFRYRPPDEFPTYATPPEIRMHGRVQDERMVAAIPRQIHETH